MIDIFVEVIFLLCLLAVAVIILTIFNPSITIPSLTGGTVLAVMQPQVRKLYVDLVEWVKFSIGGAIGGITICTYGYSGSGKTTLIKNTFTFGSLKGQERTTRRFKWYRFEPVISEDERSWKVNVRIADYQGQRPSDLILKNRITLNNVSNLIFLVDIVGRRYSNDDTDLPDSEDDIMKWLANDPSGKIEQRIADHVEVINKGMLELIFSRMANPRLNSVILIINKFDVIQRLSREGLYLTGKSDDELLVYTRSLFKDIEDKINEACFQSNLGRCKTFVIITKDTGREVQKEDKNSVRFDP